MNIGTRSLLFGVHQFALHPLFVFIAWWRLYGFPWDPRLWVAFLLHDVGYFGAPNMDGPEGETHPELGAALMGRLFGRAWGDFTLRHSGFYCRRFGLSISRLYVADKLAIVLMPWWLYIPLGTLTGEIHEYMYHGRTSGVGLTKRQWFEKVCRGVRQKVADNREGADTLNLVERGFKFALLAVACDLRLSLRRRLGRPTGGGRHEDWDPVRCEECGHVTRRKDCVHGYGDDGTGEDVVPEDECPACGHSI